MQQYKADILKRLWQHEHLLPPRYLRRGLHSVGDPARLRRFTHKLLSGGRCCWGLLLRLLEALLLGRMCSCRKMYRCCCCVRLQSENTDCRAASAAQLATRTVCSLQPGRAKLLGWQPTDCRGQ
jgi:hypothetical protein